MSWIEQVVHGTLLLNSSFYFLLIIVVAIVESHRETTERLSTLLYISHAPYLRINQQPNRLRDSQSVVFRHHKQYIHVRIYVLV